MSRRRRPGPRRPRNDVVHSARFNLDTDRDALAMIDRVMVQEVSFKQVVIAALAESNGLDVGDLINSKFSPREVRELSTGIARLLNLDFAYMTHQLSELTEVVLQLADEMQQLRQQINTLEAVGMSTKPSAKKGKKNESAKRNLLAMLSNASSSDELGE